MALNNSPDLTSGLGYQYKIFWKQTNEINEIKIIWNEKRKTLAEEGYSQKEIENLNIELQKLNDIKLLKNQSIQGPFTSPDVKKFITTEPESKT